MNPLLTSRWPIVGWQINELTIATPVWSASFCNRQMISPSIVSANSGWSVQNPVANISGNTATSALLANAAIRSSAKRKFVSLSAHAIGYCSSATFIVNRYEFFCKGNKKMRFDKVNTKNVAYMKKK